MAMLMPKALTFTLDLGVVSSPVLVVTFLLLFLSSGSNAV